MDFEEWAESPKGSYVDAESAWNASAEAHKPRWIPVSERLPDKDIRAAVIQNTYKDCQALKIDHYSVNHKTFLFGHINVTHWLELPEMPE